MFRNMVSIFLGFVLIIILAIARTSLCNYIVHQVIKIEQSFTTLQAVVLYSSVLLSDIFIATLAGYFTVAMVGNSRMRAAKILSGIMFCFGGSAFFFASFNATPWTGLLNTVLTLLRLFSYVACIIVGGFIRCKQKMPCEITEPNTQNATD